MDQYYPILPLVLVNVPNNNPFSGLFSPVDQQDNNTETWCQFFLFSAADECTDDVDSCEMRMDPVGLNRDGDLCYGIK